MTRLLALLLLATPASAQELSSFTSPDDCGRYRYDAELVRVYDADTAWFNFDLGFNTWRMNEPVRLLGIDAPELRGPERPQGIVARDALIKHLEGKTMEVCTVKDRSDSFGRYLAIIFADGENVNQWLLDEGYAEVYAR